MSINKDLNIDPYYENFYDSANPQYKQYNKVLFRPARAVQARELTQLQTILQEQVERFGSNVYQEGTVITGINVTERTDIFYVKVNDTASLPDPTVYEPSTSVDVNTGEEVTTEYTLRKQGGAGQLTAKILKAANGFQTRDPNLKTFFVNYLNTVQASDGADIKQFAPGDVLDILDSDGNAISGVSATVASVNNPVGHAFGASVDEGVIFQKGHFVFVEDQLIIIEKYSLTPRDVALGFNIEENIITSGQDNTLLDNAQGYNNDNAPGADRLQLKPILTAYEAADEPDDFFALVRFENGEAVTIRNVTQFNSIAQTMARRTFEESGDYVTRGMNLSLEDDGTNIQAVVSPGKAYVNGYEVESVGKRYLTVAPLGSSDTILRQNEGTGAHFGQYYEFSWQAPSGTPGDAITLNPFDVDGTRYNMYDNGNNVIGTCSIGSISQGPSVNGTQQGRLYVYAVDKLAAYINTDVHKIGDTLVTAGLFDINHSALVFPLGSNHVKEISDLVFVRRVRETLSTATGAFVLEPTPTTQPLAENIFMVNTATQLVPPITNNASGVTTSAFPSGGTQINVAAPDQLGDGALAYVYYDRLEREVAADSLSAIDVYMTLTYDTTNDIGNIGLPNGVKLLEVIDDTGAGENITNRFRLVNNQKDSYYDLSYIQLKKGQSLNNTGATGTSLRVRVTVLRRTSTVGNGYLTVDSYSGVDKKLLKRFSTLSGLAIDLPNAIDFRPYATPAIIYSTGIAGAPAVPGSITKSVVPNVAIADRSTILATHEVFLPRIDSVVVDSRGEFDIVQGSPAEKPSIPAVKDVFQLGEIYIPGAALTLSGSNPVKISTKTIRNYTMKDITQFDTRIKRLTNQVALNALEKAASEMFIPDSTGANRFKNGFLVDTFESFATSDVADPEFKMAIDPSYKVGMPALKTFNVDLKRRTTTSSGISPFGEFTTLAEDGSRNVQIEQPYATNFRNCVSNFYNYEGSVDISPKFSSDYDTIRNPDTNITIDLATPMIDFMENLQEFIPLTRDQEVGDVFLADSSTAPNRREGRTIIGGVNETWRQDWETLSIGVDTNENTQEGVGDFVTDISLRPYVKAKEVKVLVTGLRPNTRHYFYFADGVDVNAHVTPGQYVAQDNGDGTQAVGVQDVFPKKGQSGATTSPGQAVVSDNKGVLAAIFNIPGGTFFAGENKLEVSDVSQYSSIESAGTSYGTVTYRAYSFGISKSALDVTTRSPDFRTDVVDTFSTDNVTFRETWRRRTDPLAQTFFIKTGMGQGAKSIYVKDIDLFFKRKDAVVGFTLELREVINGYPSSKVLPFGRKYMTSSEVAVSDTGTAATTVSFDNPVKLDVEREYAFVVLPDANSPEYLIWTSKVGGTDLASGAGTPVTQDWGEGVLFTSTNNRAWKSYQDEDVKFRIKKLNFATQTGYVDLIPNNPEFLTLTGTVGAFQDGEFAYVKKTSGGSYTSSGNNTLTGDGREITINQSTAFAVGDYIVLEKGSEKKVTKILAKAETSGITTLTVDSPVIFDTSVVGNVTATFVVGGYVQFYNSSKPTEVHLTESSARQNFRIIGNSTETLTGEKSGCTATVTSVFDADISYFQPIIHKYNTLKTSTKMKLMSGDPTLDGTPGSQMATDKSIAGNTSVYLTGNPRSIPSQSNIVDAGQSVSEDFAIRVEMNNNSYTSTSPSVDDDLSMLTVYQYDITESDTTTSTYISKQATLSDRMYAEGLKVILGAYRPAGTMIDVYARFVIPTNVENFTDWMQLTQETAEVFSSSHNIRDHREIEYNLPEQDPAFLGTNEYSAFQLKIVMRHMTQAELDANSQPITTGIHVYPHLADYRAIAIT